MRIGIASLAASLLLGACSQDRRAVTEELLPSLGALPARVAPIGWSYYGGDQGQTRWSPVTEIDRRTVTRLRPAWIWWAGDTALHEAAGQQEVLPGQFEVSPLVVGDTMYVV